MRCIRSSRKNIRIVSIHSMDRRILLKSQSDMFVKNFFSFHGSALTISFDLVHCTAVYNSYITECIIENNFSWIELQHERFHWTERCVIKNNLYASLNFAYFPNIIQSKRTTFLSKQMMKQVLLEYSFRSRSSFAFYSEHWLHVWDTVVGTFRFRKWKEYEPEHTNIWLHMYENIHQTFKTLDNKCQLCNASVYVSNAFNYAILKIDAR